MAKTPEKFLLDVANKWGDEYTVLKPNQYINAHSKMEIRHNICKRVSIIEANSFLCGHGCPRCAYENAGVRKIQKYKDIFLSRLPGSIIPLSDYRGSKEKMLFKCAICNSEFKTTPDDFSNVMKLGCPCCKKERVLKEMRKDSKEYAQEFYDIHQGNFEIVEDYVRQIDKIKIRCLKCDTDFYRLPSSALSPKMRCFYCDWGIKEISLEELNNSKRKNYTVVSNNIINKLSDKIEVRHDICNRNFITSVRSFLKGVGCPYCSNRIITQEEWEKRCKDKLGDEYEVLDNFKGDNVPIKVYHKKCGNFYYTRPSSIRAGHGCPKCKQSKGEKRISVFLRDKKEIYECQKTFAWTNPNRYRYDFFIPRLNLIIEYNGSQHYIYSPFFKKTLEEQKEIDIRKKRLALNNGYNYLIISYKEFDKIEEILEKKLGGK